VFDLLGREFTLVCAGGDASPFSQAAARLGIPLSVVHADESYAQPLVLVRPDLFIAWSGAAPPADVDGLLRRLAGFGTVTADLPTVAS
jgi:hypothetical protein